MSEKRFFTKVNKNGRLVIIDKECHTELFDMTLACEVLNRLDLKLKYYNEVNDEQQATISALKDIFKDIITYSKWDSEKPYCSLGIAVDKKTYYKIREILNE